MDTPRCIDMNDLHKLFHFPIKKKKQLKPS